ncbi:MAG: ABC transporter ATP-binding protein, partial [Gaiellales bacterium]
LRNQPLLARARLGFVPDRPFLYDRLSAREFLDFIAAIYDVPAVLARTRGIALLERLDLAEAADDYVETYSHGMRQKLSVAAALLHDPPLTLLDEPLQGLDPRAARTLKDLLRERVAGGGGVLVSTHLLDVAERLCDRVVILRRGLKVAEGSLDDLRGPDSGATLEDVFLELTREVAETQPS